MSRPIRSGLASADNPSPASPRLGLVLTVIAAAQLMVVLDSTIVNIALPEIQHGLAFSSTGLQWVVTAYALAFGGLLLLGGRAGDMFGHRRTFLVGIALFATASLLGGLAAVPSWLVACRALQGAGAAMASPAALALIASTFPEGGPRNRAMGVYAGMGSSGGAIGLLLGGLLTEYVSWRWVMFVNVPIGALVLLVAARAVPKTAVCRGQLDLPGAITASGGLALLVYGLSNVSGHGWGATSTHGPLIAAAILLAGFLLIERFAAQPLVPLHLFRDRNRSGAYAIMLAIGAVMFAMFFFTTQYEQNVLGYSPLRSGVAFLPLTVTLVVVATVVSRVLGDRTGTRLAVTTGPLGHDRRAVLGHHGEHPQQLPGPARAVRDDVCRCGHQLRPAHPHHRGHGPARGSRHRRRPAQRLPADRRFIRPDGPRHRCRQRGQGLGAPSRHGPGAR
ncbi:MFS transporter [Streptomyces roseifaciens]|uniref:MFS transporter n=1 Tax=Streptomyces roseifaciens TaxID=1488406 RepID=UPI00099FE4C8|nr:MFS transporter [Streptomyces roseifaciens]